MPRFFIEKIIPADCEQITLDAADSHHLVNVLRARPGESVEVCDNQRTVFICRIPAIEPGSERQLTVDILERRPANSELPFKVILYQGLPKGDKLSDIVRVTVELGVVKIVPVLCARSVARPEPKKRASKAERWQAVAEAAAKQCGRAIVPEVTIPLEFGEALQDLSAESADLVFVPYESEDAVSLRRFLEHSSSDKMKAVAFFIGPEGGFAASEIAAFQESGLQTVTLGPRILRTETAAGAVLAMLGYKFEQD